MSQKDKVQIRKAIVNHGGTQFTLELNLQFHGNAALQVTSLKYKKNILSAYAHKHLLCRFFNCPVYVEYV
jgi:hypothetical protein